MNLRSILDKKLEEWILVSALGFLVLLVTSQVVSRYIIPIPLGWTIELSRYIFIWISWISVSYAIQHNEHIRVSYIKNKLPLRLNKILELIVLIIFFIFALFMLVIGTNFVMVMETSNQTSPSMGAPMWIIYLVVPISGLLICIRLIQQLILIYRK